MRSCLAHSLVFLVGMAAWGDFFGCSREGGGFPRGREGECELLDVNVEKLDFNWESY